MCTMFCLDPKSVQVVSEDGSPSGSKEYIIWDPPYVDLMAPQLGKRSSISEASLLMRYLMKRGIRVILFCKVCKYGKMLLLDADPVLQIRKVCELVHFYDVALLLRNLTNAPPGLQNTQVRFE